jgi:hypothetical protein
MGFKEKIKREFGYMKVGAKVLPSVAAKKAKAAVQGYWENVKENARLEREAELEAKKAEREAYKIALVEQAKLRGQAKGRQRASRQGAGGILAQLGAAGERMNVSDMLGLSTGKKSQEMGSPSDYLFSGMPQRKSQQTRGVESNHHHHPKKKKHRR